MKILSSLFIASAALALLSCGGLSEEDQEKTVPQGMVELDLNSNGINAILIIPDTATASLEVDVQPSGEIEILVGNNFQIAIAEGGDLELKKSDITSDLLYKGTIIAETPTSLVYKMELPDGSMTFHHFYTVVEIDGISYEVSDLDTGEPFSQKAVEAMLESAKNIKSKKSA